MKKFLALAASLCALNASPLGAQTTELEGDHAVDGAFCAGDGCSASVDFQGHAMIVRTNTTDQNGIYFDDTNLTPGFSMRDWSIRANELFQDLFSIRDADVNQNVLSIEPDAGSNALYISTGGNIGLGTSLPQTELHLIDGFSTALRLEQTTAMGQQAVRWDFSASNAGLQMVDNLANTTPLRIENGAPSGSVFVASNGNFGIGTTTPEEKLHIQTNAADTDAFALFDAAGSGSDAAFLLRQQGTVPTTWEFRNQESSGRLNVGVVGGNKPFKIDGSANTNLLRLGLSGEPDVVSITGELRVNNTQLNVPDYVFADDYALRPLADVRSFIDTNSHLPEVPSAADIARDGVNMTEMQMVLLKKVEELTLYTLALQAEVDELRGLVEQ